MSLTPDSLNELLASAELLLRDEARLRKQLPRVRDVERFQRELEQAKERAARFRSEPLRCEYPPELPVSQQRERVVEAIRTHPVIILCGDTGSGKTTQLPKMAMEAGGGTRGRIGVTQPRRLSAVSMARRVASECDTEPGRGVGLQVRFEEALSEVSRIKFMTDGILLAELPHDRDWLQYDTLIIDEAHERSLNIDFILGCLKRLLTRRSDLKVIISSATLDAQRFAAFFDQAPVLDVEGRSYPIRDLWLPPSGDEDLPEQVLRALRHLDKQEGPADTLVFLPGEREIHECEKLISGHYRHHADVLPLFARLSLAEQQRVFREGGTRRIVLATNVAETSITLPGIRYVVDSGWAKIHRYHPQSQVQMLQLEMISQASARQRRGRCGRVADGVCLRLYDEEAYATAPAFTDPEIRRVSLAEALLRMAVLGLPPMEKFPLLDPPKPALIAEGYRTLFEIGAMTRARHLTRLGRSLAAFAIEPRLARMVAEAQKERVMPALLVLAAGLSIQDPRERPLEKQEAADAAQARWLDPQSDLLGLLNLWNEVHPERASRSRLRRFATRHFLNARRLEEWANLANELRRGAGEQGWKVPESLGPVSVEDPDAIHRCVLAGIASRIGQLQEQGRYHAPNGRAFHVFPGSGLFKKPPRWVMAYTLVETSRLYARICAELKPEWVEQVAPQLCRSVFDAPHWNREQGFVQALERVVCGGLTLRADRAVHYGRVDPAACRDIFLRDALLPLDLNSTHPALAALRRLRVSLSTLDAKLRRPGMFSDGEALLRCLERTVPPDVLSVPTLERWLDAAGDTWVPDLSTLTGEEQLREQDVPDVLEIDGRAFALHYTYAPGEPEDGVTLETSQTDLEFLPASLLEWTVPAWLPEKVRLLIRSLPKPLRIACNPLPQTVEAFLDWVDREQFRYTHSLLEALCAFLRVRLQTTLGPADIDLSRVPAFLSFRLRVLDPEGAVVYEGAHFPGKGSLPTPKVPMLKAGSSPWAQRGLSTWPDLRFPESVELQGRRVFPALVDEGETVGVRVFAKAAEAEEQHRAGVLRLVRLTLPDLCAHVEKRLPLPTSVQLELSLFRRQGQDALQDLIDRILEDALGGLPRDPEGWRTVCAQVRDRLWDCAKQRAGELTRLFVLRAAALDALAANWIPAEAAADLQRQWASLWSGPFLRDPRTWERYPRYLNAIMARVERLRYGAAKDAAKQESLRPVWERAVGPLSTELRFAMEELRIQTFAPELRPHEKISLRKVLDRWDELV